MLQKRLPISGAIQTHTNRMLEHGMRDEHGLATDGAFHEPIVRWNVSRVTSMVSMIFAFVIKSSYAS